MRTLMLMPLALGVALLGRGALHAQEVEGGYEPYEHLKAMEWLVGEWTREFEDGEGGARTTVMSWEWLHDKKFLGAKWRFYNGDELAFAADDTYYWDPTEGVIRYQRFNSLGGWFSGTVEPGDGVVRLDQRGVGPRGEEAAFGFVFTRLGEDVTGYQFVGDGEPRPDPPIEYRRK